jgi:hypothetical protein
MSSPSPKKYLESVKKINGVEIREVKNYSTINGTTTSGPDAYEVCVYFDHHKKQAAICRIVSSFTEAIAYLDK